MIIDMRFTANLSNLTNEDRDGRLTDARNAAQQHYFEIRQAIEHAELAAINNRPHPVAVSTDAADRLCRACNGKGFVLDDDDVFTDCPGCAATGADTAVLHAAE